MRVRIDYAVEVPDEVRRAINVYFGKPGLASRQDVQTWYRTYGSSMDDELMELAMKVARGQAS